MTRRQSLALSFIKASIEQNGYAPTCQEIGDHLGVSGPAAWQLINALISLGRVVRRPGKWRALTVTGCAA